MKRAFSLLFNGLVDKFPTFYTLSRIRLADSHRYSIKVICETIALTKLWKGLNHDRPRWLSPKCGHRAL
jgi:hypothetical protein